MTDVLGLTASSLTFHVDEPTVDGGHLGLHYRITGPRSWVFTEQVDLPDVDAPLPVPQRVVRLLALVAGLSYYKALVPATIEVGWALTDDERRLLQALLQGGLGEFAYRNDLPEALSPTVVAARTEAPTHAAGPPAEPGPMLVAVGGGKDSIVTLESLRHLDDVTLFSVNTYAPITATAEAAGLPLVTARRRIDPALFALNDEGAYNGHVPVTAINSLIACLTALRAGIGTVVFSNEASASTGNLSWELPDGSTTEVNHQWSKGIELETLLRATLVGTGVEYVSFLRPLTEIAIMRRFAGLTGYHRVFTSCNRSFHLDPTLRTSWCGHCPKCLFVALVLAPFVSPEQLQAIFARDPLADPDNLAGLLDLLAIGPGYKPFECVGEPDECRAAVTLLRRDPRWAAHPLLQRPELAGIDLADAEIDALFAFSPVHFLGARLEQAARAVL